MPIVVRPLGAGQDVGGSCVWVTIGGRNILFDCGMHMGFDDERRFPNFTSIAPTGPYTDHVQCLIISHFHLDHCGALPHFTEQKGYKGPILMTYPTRAIIPFLLEDYRRVSVERRGIQNFFTPKNITDSLGKVTTINVRESITVGDGIQVRAWYAGHVLGAALWEVRVGNESVIYTGDYNMTPDRHLGAAFVSTVRPDLLITESTYCTTIRDSRRARECDFLQRVHDCIDNGGKVLIPVFALGRAQELLILLDMYWERMNLRVPIYFTTGLVQRANEVYTLFINWTNQKIKDTYHKRNLFDFRHVEPFDRQVADLPHPMVLLASPGMLHGGMSLEVFKKWAPFEQNLVILPGYCSPGTVGNKIYPSGAKHVEVDGKVIDVKCKVISLSFSAHADAKGIAQLIKMAQPRNVLLVHGEAEKMEYMKHKVEKEFKIPCHFPPNQGQVTIHPADVIPATLSSSLLKDAGPKIVHSSLFTLPQDVPSLRPPKRPRKLPNKAPLHGVVVCKNQVVQFLTPKEASNELHLPRHHLHYTMKRKIPSYADINALNQQILQQLQRIYPTTVAKGNLIELKSLTLVLNAPSRILEIKWSHQDDHIYSHVKSAIDTIFSEFTAPTPTPPRVSTSVQPHPQESGKREQPQQMEPPQRRERSQPHKREHTPQSHEQPMPNSILHHPSPVHQAQQIQSPSSHSAAINPEQQYWPQYQPQSLLPPQMLHQQQILAQPQMYIPTPPQPLPQQQIQQVRVLHPRMPLRQSEDVQQQQQQRTFHPPTLDQQQQQYQQYTHPHQRTHSQHTQMHTQQPQTHMIQQQQQQQYPGDYASAGDNYDGGDESDQDSEDSDDDQFQQGDQQFDDEQSFQQLPQNPIHVPMPIRAKTTPQPQPQPPPPQLPSVKKILENSM
ncbi:integrator complex subunit 11 [Pelomyxa schiedti]|nr:integrator complex subunit 11 [Pelomyxa schiedti]